MNKIIMLSVLTASLLFTGCGEKTKNTATETTDEVVKSAKELGSQAVDATKEAATKVAEAAKKAEVAVKDTVAKAAVSASTSIVNAAGKSAYAKCAGCHGVDGKTKALGKSPVLAGQSKEELSTKLHGYKAGTINVAGMGSLMKGQVKDMDDTTIEAISIYISTLK